MFFWRAMVNCMTEDFVGKLANMWDQCHNLPYTQFSNLWIIVHGKSFNHGKVAGPITVIAQNDQYTLTAGSI